MLKIGDFSKLSRVSIRMLRHYDEVGLLKPARIDPFTDYRYYSEAQLPVVFRITALRDIGFGLAEILSILPIYDDAERLEACFEKQRMILLQQQAVTAQQLRLLDTAQKRLRKEKNMDYNITVKTLPERYAACVRTTIPCYEAEGSVWQLLCQETDFMHLVPDNPCYCSVVFLDNEYKEENVTIEAQKTVKGAYNDTEHVRFRTLPPVTYAGCTYQGGYDQINDVIAATTAWIEANGYDYDGPMLNIYHVSPHETSDPSQFVTEVCYPLRKK